MLTKPLTQMLHRGHPLARGLVGAWTFHEGAGSIAHNAASLGDGTISGNPIWTPKGLTLDGTGDYILMGADPHFDLTTALSMFLSFRIHDRTIGGGVVPRTLMGRGAEGYRMYVDTFNAYCFTFDLGLWAVDFSTYKTTLLVQNNTSYTLAATWCGDGGNQPQTVYINGAYEGEANRVQATIGNSQAADQLSIGALSDYPTWTSNMTVYVGLLYDRRITAGEVARLHVDPYQMFGRPSGLVVAAFAVPGMTTVQLDWIDHSEHEDGFSIERKTDAGAFGEIDTVAAGIETYNNVNVAIGHTYTYRVRAISATLGDSEYSNEAEVIVA